MGRTGSEMERLQEIMARLRAEGGCPWDRAQDLRSLRPYLVEETYEVLDEMDRVAEGGAWHSLCEELGDLLFQIVFHAQLANEIGEFQLADVAQAISDKIVRRHPHVFSDLRVAGAEEVLQNWARLKAEERRARTGSEGSVLHGVPTAAPALLRAERLTEKASRIGFDWPDIAGVREKLDEELGELDQAIASGDRQAVEHELGDVLFSLANLARFLATPAEDALRAANRRFTERFHAVEQGLRQRGVAFGHATLEEMDALWEEAKAAEAALPRPTRASRASAVEMRLSVPAAAAAFWARVAPLLGWPVSFEDSRVRCETGPLALVFVPGESRGQAAVELQARCAPGLPRLDDAIRAAGGTAELLADACVIRDPAGAVVVRCLT
jgi:ATP diphosphatase